MKGGSWSSFLGGLSWLWVDHGGCFGQEKHDSWTLKMGSGDSNRRKQGMDSDTEEATCLFLFYHFKGLRLKAIKHREDLR